MLANVPRKVPNFGGDSDPNLEKKFSFERKILFLIELFPDAKWILPSQFGLAVFGLSTGDRFDGGSGFRRWGPL